MREEGAEAGRLNCGRGVGRQIGAGDAIPARQRRIEESRGDARYGGTAGHWSSGGTVVHEWR
jgi:hypothetical protein